MGKITETKSYQVFHRQYRTFPISCHKTPGHYDKESGRQWSLTGYVFINKANCPDVATWNTIYTEDYFSSELLCGLPWHCGITYSSLEEDNLLKMGCDYQHAYDNYDPDENIVLGDLESVVDKLIDVHGFKVRDYWNREYMPESEGEYSEWGSFRKTSTESKSNG